jgi:sulfatase maturation enzyme AslB (radical SAM superfamily)
MANKFCKNLSNTYFFSKPKLGEGVAYRPCCWTQPSEPIKNVDHLKIIQILTAEKIMNNPSLYCTECISRDAHGYSKSRREITSGYIPDEAEDGDPYILEFKIDTTCNAACVMCGPTQSSLWRKQLYPDSTPMDYTADIDEAIALVDFSKVTRVQFYGGEPLVTDSHIRVLKQILNPAEVTVHYTTNGSVFPDQEVLDLWNTFKKIQLLISIDGIGSQFEYIRWPLKWNKIEQNVMKFAALTLRTELKLFVNFTANPMNIYNFDKFEAWYSALPVDKFSPFKLNVCVGTWGIDATPELLRIAVKEKYGPDHRLSMVLDSHPEVSGKFDLLYENMVALDTKRNLSSKDTFKEELVIALVTELV